MALHTVVFLGGTIAVWKPLAGVSDGVFGLLGEGLIPPQETRLVAAIAGGEGLIGARLEQRSMDITPVNIRPLNVFPWPSPAGAMSHPAHAPRLPGGETVVASAINSAGGVAVVCWFADRVDPVPPGESYMLAFTATLPLVADTWVRTSLTWEVPYLPAGRYHIVGMEVYCETIAVLDVVAARLLLPNQVHRPGAIVFTDPVVAAASEKLPPAFQTDGSLGVWGWFEQGSPPALEVIGRTTSDPEEAVTLRGHLRVVKAAGSVGGTTAGRGPTWG